MQLPDDVVTIISDYSKPSFVYFREYNHVLELHNLTEWRTLKELLVGPLKEETVYHLRIYIKGYEEWKSAMKIENAEWEKGGEFKNVTKRAQMNGETMEKMGAVFNLFSGLTLLMYGEIKSPYQLRDKYDPTKWI